MPLSPEWINALISSHRVRIISTPQLLNQITAAGAARVAAGHQMKSLSVVSRFDPPVVHQFRLMELLHALGEITTPIVPNYSDLSSTWAILRYIWAFELPQAGRAASLTLSTAAKGLDFHQKGLLSDQIGVAMTALIMKQLFGMPAAIDISIAVDDPAWHLSPPAGRSPDYLFMTELRTDRCLS